MTITKQKTTLALAIASLCGSGAMVWTAPVFAEEAASEPVEKIMVTGSRIARANLSKPGAVTTISRSDIEQTGFKNIGDMLQNLTVSASAPNASQNENTSGVTNFDLRGLGAQRTLVLLNGRRLPNGGNGADAAVDLSAIPTAIIERVEILLDGASSIYGSDAVSGVVNIITRQTGDIFEVSGSIGQSAEGDADTTSLELVTGIVGDKGRFMVSASYDEKQEVYAGDRDFSRYDLTLNPDGSYGQGGSSAMPWSNLKVTDENGKEIFVTRGPEYGEWRETISDASLAQNDLYNYQEPSLLQTPFERYSMSAFGEYDLGNLKFSDDVVFNFEALYSHRKSTTNGAPQPLVPVWGGYLDFTYSPDNYYNQQFGPKDKDGNPYAINDWRRRMVETNGRMNHVENSQYRIVMALSGDFNADWSWELAYNFGRNSNKRLKTGIFNWPAAKNAVGPTHFDEQGVLRCGATPDALIAGCVPLNIFGQPGTDSEISEDMLNYLSGDWPGIQQGHNQIKIASANLSGVVASLPAGDLGVSFGIENQKVEARNQTDAVSINILVTDGLGRPTGGEYSLNEAYLEAVVPLLSDHDWAQSLELNLATRYSDFDTFGSTTNSKVGVFWALNEQLSFRGTWSQAFRAPNVVELYKGRLPDFENGDDPCAVANPNQNCVSTGVPADGSYRETIGQIRTNTGGNTELEPETATSKTLGVIYQPSWLTNGSITLDFYDIQLKDAIGNISAVTKLSECMNNGLYCDSVHRVQSGEFQGVITGVDVFNENLNALNRQGVDAEVRFDIGQFSFGDLSTALNWSFVSKHEVIEPGLVTKDRAGQRVNGQMAVPEHRVNFALNWQHDDFSASWQSYYIDSMLEEVSVKQGDQIVNFTNTVDSTLTHNAQVTYHLDSVDTQITLGVNNLLNEAPPFATGNGNNADPIHSSLYLGREYYLRFKTEF
ncbi:TonB-dependent receptor [Pseudoalteromonas sp. JC28]|uniref:TonB-dependent receptor plug domain-containing protein n=1 Tax=Pseudoalteromonas sp. JC28 TaxID=2267617 RepID=UPI001574B313|nr:TonB-dependent receptor [Pseudoalteromonas sp. JC28]NSY35759.1 TonB-dependent receptor [Pseudoalteromonas sp. JC28]